MTHQRCLAIVSLSAHAGMEQPARTEAVSVASPQQLVDAILEDHAHIVVTAHLDLTTLPIRENSICPDGCASPLPEIRAAQSIRVRTSNLMHACLSATPSPPGSCRSLRGVIGRNASVTPCRRRRPQRPLLLGVSSRPLCRAFAVCRSHAAHATCIAGTDSGLKPGQSGRS